MPSPRARIASARASSSAEATSAPTPSAGHAAHPIASVERPVGQLDRHDEPRGERGRDDVERGVVHGELRTVDARDHDERDRNGPLHAEHENDGEQGDRHDADPQAGVVNAAARTGERECDERPRAGDRDPARR
jgi:hypothetical protein